MRYLLFLFATALIACNSSPISTRLSQSDSLIIQYQPGTEHMPVTVATTEEKAIRKMTGFVDGPETKEFDCSYEGKLLFFRDGSLWQEINFMQSRDSCRHFSFVLDGQRMNTSMTNEASDFLKSLSEGRSWY